MNKRGGGALGNLASECALGIIFCQRPGIAHLNSTQ